MKYTSQIMFTLTLLFILGMSFGVTREAWGQAPSYIGGAKCRLCHMKQHEVWDRSKHATAFEILKPEDRNNPKCLSCHLTGYGATQQVNLELVGVQCEACHGPGSLYLRIHARRDKEGARKAGLISRPGPESCRVCHNKESPTFKGFDYAGMWEKIKHPK